MGYDVHITRRADWFDEDGAEISLAEWLAYVQSDPEMRLGHGEARPKNGEFLRAESKSLCVWTGYSRHLEGERMAWFALYRGSIVVKNPDPEILRKMYQISCALTARVQGDEGEFYGSAGEPVR